MADVQLRSAAPPVNLEPSKRLTIGVSLSAVVRPLPRLRLLYVGSCESQLGQISRKFSRRLFVGFPSMWSNTNARGRLSHALAPPQIAQHPD
jgi:hypothetical protein